MDKFLGVIGGMGPLATADFLRKLVENTPASIDQDHIPVLLYGDCTTPDRTANIVGKGPSPLPKLLAGIRHLNAAGVKAICIPCNSAHCWYDDMSAASLVPVFHIVRSSAEQVRKKNPATKTVGVLSTFGTYQMGIYTKTLQAMGFNVVCPTEEEFHTLVSEAIAMIKANRLDDAEALFRTAADKLTERGAEIIILGCTEIPIGMQKQYRANPSRFVDSNEALAASVIEYFSNVLCSQLN
jgi:aspartate racemase